MIHPIGGVYLLSSNSFWLPGLYATERAARMAYHRRDEDLRAAWEARLAEWGGAIPEGRDAEAALTEDDVRVIPTRGEATR